MGPECNQDGPPTPSRRDGDPLNKYAMPVTRVKKNVWWTLTWSPEDEVTELPDFLEEWFKDHSVIRVVAIRERHTAICKCKCPVGKWHIHAGLEYYRAYNSDYTDWFTDVAKEAGMAKPALEFTAHRNLLGLVGGYCTKSDDREVLFQKGFSEEQLEWGRNEYAKGLRKERVKRRLAEIHIIQPDKIDAAIGIQMAELGTDNRDEAIVGLVADGWAFARSIKGTEVMYKQLYLDRQKHESTVSDSI